MSYYGDPILTIRCPQWQIDGLKVLSRSENCTVSELMRDLIIAILADSGITERTMATLKETRNA